MPTTGQIPQELLYRLALLRDLKRETEMLSRGIVELLEQGGTPSKSVSSPLTCDISSAQCSRRTSSSPRWVQQPSNNSGSELA